MTTHSLPEAIERVRQLERALTGTPVLVDFAERVRTIEAVRKVCAAASRAEAAERERDDAVRQRDEAQRERREAVESQAYTAERLAAAERELEALREDKARLDWLSPALLLGWMIDRGGFRLRRGRCQWGTGEQRISLRSAIDTARRSECDCGGSRELDDGGKQVHYVGCASLAARTTPPTGTKEDERGE